MSSLLEQEIHDPFDGFVRWFELAKSLATPNPNAFVLSSCDKNGSPNARVVLLKKYDRDGFVFFTNYSSQKSQELANNNACHLLFFWDLLQLQIRILGHAKKVSRAESVSYFQTRPQLSKIGAWASKQSQRLDSYESFTAKVEELKAHYQNKEVPCPEFWGGWRIVPHSFEFWCGHEGRLHERLVFNKENEQWHKTLLFP